MLWRKLLGPILVLAFLFAPAAAQAAEVPLGSRSFDTAYAQEPCGTTITIPNGASLGGQNIDRVGKLCSIADPVVFRPASGTATVSSLRVSSGAHIEFRDLTVNGNFYLGCNCSASGSSGNQVQNITFLRSTAKTFIFRSPDYVKVIDSSIGPSSTGAMNWITAGYQSNDPATNITFDGTRIHDILADDGQDHTDCIGVDDVDGFTFRDGVIEDCQHFSIIFGGPDSATGRMARNVLVENSVIDCCTAGAGSNGPGFYSLAWGGIGGPQIIRNNTLPGASVGFVGLDENWTDGLLRFEGNTFQRINTAVCPRATWVGNTFLTGDGCGTAPEPTPTPTPEPTPTPTPEPTPTPTPTPYDPECAPTCDELIADLRADVAAHEATIAQLTASRDNWQTRALDAEDKLDRIAAILAE